MGQLGEVAIIMRRTDRFEAFPEGDAALLSRQIRDIKAAADLVIYAAPHLAEEEASVVRRARVVTHGVDLEMFTAAGVARDDGPSDVAAIRRPRAGFIGGLDAHTFDPELLASVASRMPDVEFVLVGGSSLPEGWCERPNVHFLGRKPYTEVARYMAAMDVLLMPWNRSEWIKACNPIKLKEYLAVGRPVVTTDFAALAPLRDLVTVAQTADDFVASIRSALARPHDGASVGQRLAGESWDAKADAVREHILEVGLAYAPASSLGARHSPLVPQPPIRITP